MTSNEPIPEKEKKRLSRLTSKINRGKYTNKDEEQLKYFLWYWFGFDADEVVNEWKRQGQINLIHNCKTVEELLKWMHTEEEDEAKDIDFECKSIERGVFDSIEIMKDYLQEKKERITKFENSVKIGSKYLLEKLEKSKGREFRKYCKRYAIFSYLAEKYAHQQVIEEPNARFEELLKEYVKGRTLKYYKTKFRHINKNLTLIKSSVTKEETLKDLTGIIENSKIEIPFECKKSEDIYFTEDEHAVEKLKQKVDYFSKLYLSSFIMDLEKEATENKPQIIIDILASTYQGNIKCFVKICT